MKKIIKASVVDNLEVARDILLDSGLVSEESLNLVERINGVSMKTYEDVLYVVTGYRSFDQYEEDNEYFANLS